MADLNSSLISDFNWLPVLEFKDFGMNPFGSLWDNNSFEASSQNALDPSLTSPSHPIMTPTQEHFVPVASGHTPGEYVT